ncbi:hypothetical protein ACLOJK_013477 [Asimina triloba]
MQLNLSKIKPLPKERSSPTAPPGLGKMKTTGVQGRSDCRNHQFGHAMGKNRGDSLNDRLEGLKQDFLKRSAVWDKKIGGVDSFTPAAASFSWRSVEGFASQVPVDRRGTSEELKIPPQVPPGTPINCSLKIRSKIAGPKVGLVREVLEMIQKRRVEDNWLRDAG